ncbi:peroxin [Podila minutissima]|uniref:Peroxin n=1 Tax=Podila minutissima TaxID=64525 RepID=A0A9P5SGB9_9FUNG|nr:peroxin [Podila minutissima]
MISTVAGFANRHRRGLAITAGITGGIYMMGKYAKSKLIEFQEKSSSERTAKENMKRRFEQNQQDCVFTVLSLLPTLGDQLLHELNVELITAKLQQTRSQRPTPLPTPDTSMVLPPKPSEASNGEHEANGEIKENNSATGDDQDHTKEEIDKSEEANTEESPKATEGTEAPKEETNSTQANGHAEKTEVSEKSESIEDTTHVNGSSPSTPEIKIQEESSSTNSEKEQLHKAAQTIVRDEAAAAIDRRTKLELWNELKVMSFTRTVTALYSLTFLTLLTQVQLNLLGRFTYVSSVVALSSSTDASVRVESPTKGSMSSTSGQLDFQTEKKYLTFSYWLLHEGWRRWSEKVREVVEDIVGSISLKKTLTAREFSELLGEIRTRLEYTQVDGAQVPVNMREYMLPDEASDEREVLRAGGVDEFDLIVDPVLRNLLDETRDFIDSEDFSTVLNSTLNATFARFSLALQPTFNPFLSQSRNAVIEEIEDDDDIDRAVPLASLLPLIARQVHLIINGVPNEYVESLAMVKELQAFSAIVYSSFNEQFSN